MERYEEAINDYKKIIELELDLPVYLSCKALIELNQYNEAIIEFDKEDDILLSYLYTDDTRKFDIEHIQNSHIIFSISETRCYLRKKGSLKKESSFKITQNALIQHFLILKTKIHYTPLV